MGDGKTISIKSGVTLTLENITLRGVSIEVESGGTLVMNNAATITGNNDSGVSVVGTFTMNGGSITNNKNGVDVDGTFTMNNGRIENNNTTSYGGGVFVFTNGTFRMTGGTITGNRASGNGGGVYVTYSSSSTFRMTGGTIYGSNGGSNANIAGRGKAVYNNKAFFSARDLTIRQYP